MGKRSETSFFLSVSYSPSTCWRHKNKLLFSSLNYWADNECQFMGIFTNFFFCYNWKGIVYMHKFRLICKAKFLRDFSLYCTSVVAVPNCSYHYSTQWAQDELELRGHTVTGECDKEIVDVCVYVYQKPISKCISFTLIWCSVAVRATRKRHSNKSHKRIRCCCKCAQKLYLFNRFFSLVHDAVRSVPFIHFIHFACTEECVNILDFTVHNVCSVTMRCIATDKCYF